MTRVLEQDIQKQIIDYLRLKKWFVIKNNTTGIYVKSRDAYITNPSKGLADLLCIKKGRVVLIEVKTPKGVQSDNQKEFEKEWTKHGGEYLLIHSLEELCDTL